MPRCSHVSCTPFYFYFLKITIVEKIIVDIHQRREEEISVKVHDSHVQRLVVVMDLHLLAPSALLGQAGERELAEMHTK